MIKSPNHRSGKMLIALLGLLLLPAVGQADLAVTYTTVEAELILFGQPQSAPFGNVGFKMLIKGPRVRTETTDHNGRTSWQLVDREEGTAFEMDPASKSYRKLGGQWNCENLAAQIGHWAAYWIRLSGTDTLLMDSPIRASLGSQSVDKCAFHFQGKLLGAPRPVAADLIVSMPADESNALGAGGQAELYCDNKPTQAEWSSAFQTYLPLSGRESTELASVTGLPLQIELNTDLGLGQARLVVRASLIAHDDLSAELFQIPRDFTLSE